ncbi:hypothetical protein CP10139811_0024 [Chlamydia ibidis]|uniref:Uncharacterized protein n=2 Tax=Chlamydia ibidis TaxID=1405396 RepID=S7J668_9CHLA|nr:hypothetical protein [Chlamydia ibidis]EPP35662.1 hypothetical protein CP10139811_0024 [Chlamydia ibidis]EQM62759.1 hypothetical protein H359_0469 [Chlamydia ibidis 10-1398/6]
MWLVVKYLALHFFSVYHALVVGSSYFFLASRNAGGTFCPLYAWVGRYF